MPMTAAPARTRSPRLALLAAALLAGCSGTGGNFDETGLQMLTPGQSTYAEAVDALGALPTASYRQSNGTVLAHWSYKASAVTDALYYRKQAMLQFGPDGRLLRVTETTNILLEPWKRRQLLGAGTGSAMMP